METIKNLLKRIKKEGFKMFRSQKQIRKNEEKEALEIRIKELEEQQELSNVKEKLEKVGKKYNVELTIEKGNYFGFSYMSMFYARAFGVEPKEEPKHDDYRVFINSKELTFGTLEELNKEVKNSLIDTRIKAYLYDEEHKPIEQPKDEANEDDDCEDDEN